MSRALFTLTILCSLAIAKDRKLPAGEAANELVAMSATMYDAEAVKAAVGGSLDQEYIVLELKVHPVRGEPHEVNLATLTRKPPWCQDPA